MSVAWYLIFAGGVFFVLYVLGFPPIFFIGYAAIAVGGFVLMMRDRSRMAFQAGPWPVTADHEATIRHVIESYVDLNEEYQVLTTGLFVPPESFDALDRWATSPTGRLWVQQHTGAGGLPRACPSVRDHWAKFGRLG